MKFKVGDKVKIIKTQWEHQKLGEIAIIVYISHNISINYLNNKARNTNGGWVMDPSCLIKINSDLIKKRLGII